MAEPRCVLFVDDEPNILQGVRRIMRQHIGTFEPLFASNGQQALAILEQKPVHILVTDMRMPEMSGTTLLKHVLRRYPGVVRVILSGQSETSVSLQASVLAHQYLMKPCSHESLLRVLQQACSISEMIVQPQLRQVIASMKTIPSLPTLYVRLTRMLESHDTSIEEIGRVIESDVGMSAKVMQLVNSAYFGLSSHVSSPSHAASLLGLNTLRSLILSVHIFDRFSPANIPDSWSDWLWKHSLNSGRISRVLLKHLSTEKRLQDHAYIAGILHDIGIIILAHNFPRQHQQVLSLSIQKNIQVYEAEYKIFGTTHMEIGAYLLSIWGFPTAVVDAVRYHHFPSRAPAQELPALSAVHLAEHYDTNLHGTWKGINPSPLDADYIKQRNLDSRLDTWACEIKQVLTGVPDE